MCKRQLWNVLWNITEYQKKIKASEQVCVNVRLVNVMTMPCLAFVVACFNLTNINTKIYVIMKEMNETE
jgi:hypothetical protein